MLSFVLASKGCCQSFYHYLRQLGSFVSVNYRQEQREGFGQILRKNLKDENLLFSNVQMLLVMAMIVTMGIGLGMIQAMIDPESQDVFSAFNLMAIEFQMSTFFGIIVGSFCGASLEVLRNLEIRRQSEFY